MQAPVQPPMQEPMQASVQPPMQEPMQAPVQPALFCKECGARLENGVCPRCGTPAQQ